ncbi:hypothetical protein BBJ28_00013093 [Nothophytophthora sp. Chile5]|nr:hypothetical protein BBJ28_00013093 [Nothophytophthora sp. Chile5]
MGCGSSSETTTRPPPPPPLKRAGFQPIPDRYETIGGRRICVISVIGRVLQAFDDDNIIPAFGFGDLTTKGNSCFSFTPGRGCRGFEEVLQRYNEITPTLKLSGPTNFAPVIREAIQAVQQSRGYHILVIVADGQVTNEDATRQAIVEASNWPICTFLRCIVVWLLLMLMDRSPLCATVAIIMVGVGDGPWNMMEEFDDKLPARRFDNFQFVEYNAVMQLNKKNPEAGFAIMALMEIPGTSPVLDVLNVFV